MAMLSARELWLARALDRPRRLCLRMSSVLSVGRIVYRGTGPLRCRRLSYEVQPAGRLGIRLKCMEGCVKIGCYEPTM